MKKVFVLGYHGFRNVGDDAILLAFLKSIKKYFLDLINKVYLYAYLKDLDIIKKNEKMLNLDSSNLKIISNLFDGFRAFLVSDIIVVTGGGHLHDYGSKSSKLKIFFAWFLIFLLAKILRKKVIMLNTSININSKLVSMYFKIISRLIDRISFRDKDSYIAAKRIGFSKTILGFDTATLLDPSDLKIFNTYREKSSNRILIALNLTAIHKHYFGKMELDYEIIDKIARSIAKIMELYDVEIELFVFTTSKRSWDIWIAKKFIEQIPSHLRPRIRLFVYDGSIGDLLTELSRADVIIASKFHSQVFAYLLRKPFVSILLHPKNVYFARDVGAPNETMIDIKAVPENVLLAKLIQIVESVKECRMYNCDYEHLMPKLSIDIAKKRAYYGIYSCLQIINTS